MLVRVIECYLVIFSIVVDVSRLFQLNFSRLLAHNGEINTIQGNMKNMVAREGNMKSSYYENNLQKYENFPSTNQRNIFLARASSYPATDLNFYLNLNPKPCPFLNTAPYPNLNASPFSNPSLRSTPNSNPYPNPHPKLTLNLTLNITLILTLHLTPILILNLALILTLHLAPILAFDRRLTLTLTLIRILTRSLP